VWLNLKIAIIRNLLRKITFLQFKVEKTALKINNKRYTKYTARVKNTHTDSVKQEILTNAGKYTQKDTW
jgi:hypothetical protein